MVSRHACVPLLTLAVFLAACSARQPVLYPETRHGQLDDATRARDVVECERLAATHTSPGRGGEIARTTAITTGTGAATGAVGGAIYGNAGRGAAAGAAVGATAGILHGVLAGNGPSSTYKNFVATCLGDRGYRVIGWD